MSDELTYHHGLCYVQVVGTDTYCWAHTMADAADSWDVFAGVGPWDLCCSEFVSLSDAAEMVGVL